MRVILYGIDGVMGQLMQTQLQKRSDIEIVAGINPLQKELKDNTFRQLQDCQLQADIVIDFSHPNNLSDILAYGKRTGAALLLCTTGYLEEDVEDMQHAAENCPVLLSANTSYGINLMRILLEKMVPFLEEYDVEIIEKHHNRKKDAPSGTAKIILETIERSRQTVSQPVYGRGLTSRKREVGDIGIHAVRGGTIAGEHTVLFAGEEELLEIKHTALSRTVFAEGAVKAALWLVNQPKGFYTMNDLFDI